MELYEPLPLNLRSSQKEGITPSIRAQLEFLWRGAHAVSSSTSLAQSLGRKFIDLGIKSGLTIPEQVRNRLCTWCSAILLPTITATIRVQKRGKGSKIHGKKNLVPRGDTNGSGDPDCSFVATDSTTRRKLKNQVVRKFVISWVTIFYLSIIPFHDLSGFMTPSFFLTFSSQHISQVTTCLFCTRVTKVISGCEKSSNPIKELSVKLNENKRKSFCDSMDKVEKIENAIKLEQSIMESKKFSFLQKNDRRSSAPGRMAEDFIPLSNIESNSNSSGSSFFQKARGSSQNSSSSSSSSSVSTGANIATNVPLSAALSSKLGIVNLDEEEVVSRKRPLTLLELEQMNKKEKKNRRKTLDPNNPNSPYKSSTNNNNKNNSNVPIVSYEISTVGTASLSSLQSMFMKKK